MRTSTRRITVLALALLSVFGLVAGAAAAERATSAPVTVHSGGLHQLDLALDRLELTLKPASADESLRPVLGPGQKILTARGAIHTIGVTGAATVDELLAAARALRAANPGSIVRPFLFVPGARDKDARRVLTNRIALTAADGTLTFRTIADPLDAFDAAAKAATEPGVKVAQAVAAPPRVEEKYQRKAGKPQRFDKPAEALEFWARQRVPPGETKVPMERYATAKQQMKQMPLHSTATGVTHPSVAALGMSFDTAAALGSWTALGPGNIGGRTRGLVLDPNFGTSNTMYAGGVAGGVWKSTNGGASWTPLTDLQPNLAVTTLAMAGSSTIYAGTGEGYFNIDAVRGAGIFKSTDAGANWTQLSGTANSNFFFVNKVAVNSVNASTVYAATRTGLFKSIDAGASFTQVVSVSGSTNGCTDIAIADNGGEQVVVSCGTIFTGAGGQILRSFNGAPFAQTLAQTGMERTSLAQALSDPTIIYAVSSNTLAGSTPGHDFTHGLFRVYKSSDGGVTWTTQRDVNTVGSDTSGDPSSTGGTGQFLFTNSAFSRGCFGATDLNQGWYDNVIAVDPADPTKVWVGGIDLFRSDDSGVNWGQASFWYANTSAASYVHADNHAIVFHPGYNGTTNKTMFIGNDGGLFKTTDARGTTTTDACTPTSTGMSWTNLNNNYGVTQFYHGVPLQGTDGGTTYFGGAQDNGTNIGDDVDGPNNWGSLFGGDGGYVAVDSTNTNYYLETTNLSLLRGSPGSGFNFDATSGILENPGNFLFIAPFTMAPTTSTQMWIGGVFLWRTTNGATSWSQASNDTGTMGCPAGVDQFSAFGVAPGTGNRVIAGTTTGCIFSNTTALSATPATTWTLASGTAGGPRAGYVSSFAYDPSDATGNTVYVTYSSFNNSPTGGAVGHVFKSTNGGLMWSDITNNLPDVPANWVIVDPNNPSDLFVATDVGVFSSIDGGATWNVENTGFANVATAALTPGKIGGNNYLFAFTHGRGAFRVPLVATPADVAVTVATVPASSIVAPGASINVSNTVKNVGQTPTVLTSPFAVGFALSPINPAGSDIPLGTTRASSPAPLGAGASSAATTAVMIPGNTSAGTYKIRVIGDLFNVITEDTNTANNTLQTGTFTVAIPDLTVNSVTFTPAVSAAGFNISVTHTLKNIAATGSNAPASVSGIYLATNNSFSTVIGPAIATVAAPAVNGGNTVSGAITKNPVTIPPPTPPGRYFVFLNTNDNIAFTEASTANNALAAATPLIVGPDLLITAASTVTGASPGTNVSVTFTAKNQGGASASFNVGFALVPVDGTGTPNGADIPLTPNAGSMTLNALTTGASTSRNVLIPSGTTAGSYKIRVTADPGGLVTEADETNNDRLTGVISIVRPDLTVQSVTFTPAASRANGSVAVTYIVKNNAVAPGNAPASKAHLNLSATNVNPSSFAADFGQSDIPALAAGATFTVQKNVTLPLGLASGLYYFEAQADDNETIVESNEANNQAFSLTRLLVGADLSVTAATAATGAAPGTNLSVNYTLKNAGGDAATSFSVGFTLVPFTGGVISGADIPVGPNRSAVTVAAGATLALQNNIFVPTLLAAGPYKVRVIADALNSVTEADETNNTFLSNVVNVARADLTVQSVTFTPAASRANGSVTITQVVKNLAAVPGTAPASTSTLFLNSVNNSVVGAIPLANVSVPQILGTGTASVPKSVTIPLGTAPGLYFVLAQVDSPDAILEPNEGNNLGTSVLRLIVGPDLSVATATGPAGAATGMNASVTYSLKNAGGDAATNFQVGFNLVPVTSAGVINGVEIPIGPNRSVVTVAAGATAAFTDKVLIPATTTSGFFKIRVIADGNNNVVEANETNNTLLTGIVKVARPDLIVPSVIFAPAAVASGANVSVTHIVKNATTLNGNAASSLSGIYLSQNNSFAGVLGELATVGVPPLAPNGTASVVKQVNVGALATGLYFFVVRADDANAIIEENEGNSIGASVALIVGPDVAVTAATTATGAGPGTNVSVKYTLKNQGGAATGNFSVDFVVTPVNATTGAPTGADVPLSTLRAVSSLAPGATQAFTDVVLVPAVLPAGTYRIGVHAGLGNDANLANNTLHTTGLLTVFRPDLVVNSIRFTPAVVATASGNVSVAFTVRNATPTIGNAPVSFEKVFLSGNQSVTGLVYAFPEGANISVPAILAGGTSPLITKVVSLTPSALPPGRYYFGVDLDSFGTLPEANELNNVGFSSTPLVIGPDLTVASLAAEPDTADNSVLPGATIRVTKTSTNLGGGSVLFDAGFALVPLIPAGPDIPLSTIVQNIFVGPFGSPTAFATGTVHIPLPANASAGLYAIRAMLDPANNVLEADETNNTKLSNTFNIVRPDFAINSVTFTPAALATSGFNISVTQVVANVAAAPANSGPSVSGVYLSTNSSVAGAVAFLGNVNIGLILALQTATVTNPLLIPPIVVPGQYFVVVHADEPGAFAELNETNNTRASATRLLIGPDLTVTAASTSAATVSAGEVVTINHTLKNNGAAAAAASNFSVAFSLVPVSASGTPTGADIPLGITPTALTLAGGATLPRTQALQIPTATAAGTYRVRVTADPDNVVIEGDETNNSLLTTGILNVQRGDLAVSAVSFTPAAVAFGNSSVTVSFTVKNLSATSRVGPSLAQIVLSSNVSAPVVFFSKSVTALGPGATQAFTQATLLPALPFGPYNIDVFADPNGHVGETDEGNNTLRAAGILTVGPDLVVTSVLTPTPTNINGNTGVTFTYTRKNQGGAPTGAFSINYDLVDPLASTGPLGSEVVASMAAGASLTQTKSFLVPFGCTACFVRITLDSTLGVPEADETNNVGNSPSFDTGPV